MVNSILIPVISAYYIIQNVYQTSGLVDNIFMMSITNSLIPPILLLFDPYYIYLKIRRCLKSKPGKYEAIQIVNLVKLRSNITIFIKEQLFKLDINIFTWSICLYLFVFLFLFSLSLF